MFLRNEFEILGFLILIECVQFNIGRAVIKHEVSLFQSWRFFDSEIWGVILINVKFLRYVNSMFSSSESLLPISTVVSPFSIYFSCVTFHNETLQVIFFQHCRLSLCISLFRYPVVKVFSLWRFWKGLTASCV